ncbi:MAG: MFS transporter [Rhodobacteraceae bacterium]|nr:MFS transporter [Paracoccaceae bacterium]
MTRWGVVLAIWCAGLGAAGQYAKVSIIFSQLDDVYPLPPGTLAFAVSLVGVVGILLGIVAARIVAAVGYRRTMVWCLWLGAAISAAQWMAPAFSVFLALRVIEGVSHLGLVVAAPTLIAQLSSDRARGFTMTLWSTFFGVTFTLLAWLGLPLVERAGVLSLFAAHAIYMAVLATALQVVLKSVAKLPSEPMPTLRSLPGLHAQIYASPWKNAPAAGWLFYTICFLAILTVIPPYIDPSWRAFVLGSMPLVSIAVSMTLGVAMLRHVTAVTVVQIGFLACAAASLWLWVKPGDPVACLALAAALGLVQGASFAAIPQLNTSATDRAEASGALAQAGNLGNTLGTPLLVLVLSLGGFNAMALTVLLLFLGGFAIHAVLAKARHQF